MKSAFERYLWVFIVGLSLALAGCSGDDVDCGNDCVTYDAQTSPDNVLSKFTAAYRDRNIIAYDEILADDFRFYFDPATRSELGLEYWSADQDSLATDRLFYSLDVKNIVLELLYPAGSDSVTGAGKERWRHKRVVDVFLDVDVQPTGQEVTTYRVEDQTQDFYFRQGLTPADTLESSPTADNWYLVEWRDRGTGSLAKALLGSSASEPTSWSGIKTLLN